MKETIIEEWDKIPQEIIDKCIDAFKPRLRWVIEVEARHIERYLLLVSQIDTLNMYLENMVWFWSIRKGYYNFIEWVIFLLTPVYLFDST